MTSSSQQPEPEPNKHPEVDIDEPEGPSSNDGVDHTADVEPDPDDEGIQFQQVNNFYATVTTNGIGVSGAVDPYAKPSVPRESGLLSAAKAKELLKYYLAPPRFNTAFKTLTERRFVALNAPEGCGKKAGTLELARRVCPNAEAYTVFPPTRSLAELASFKSYKNGQIYLLHDWIPVRVDSGPAASYDLEQLLDRLNASEAYMAITFEGPGHLRGILGQLCHQWSAPEPADLLEHCLGKRPVLELTDEQFSLMRSRAREFRSPRLIISLVESAKNNGVKDALAEVSQELNNAVTAWFASEPARWKVWAVTALTFLSGVGERRFERMLTALTEIDKLRDSRSADSYQTETRDAPSDQEPFPQSRWNLANDSNLKAFISERDSFGPVGMEHRPAFRTKEFRLQFMMELNVRFGDALWAPVRDWLFMIADRPFGEAQVAAGYGLALLSRCALQEVEDTYLAPWSMGDLRHRLMAVNVLWAMAEDDQCAPAALRTAVNWVWNRGQERAITAAVAFGGPLGVRYPDEALRWLWALSLRSERVGRFARIAMSQLFAVEAESEIEKSAVLPYVLKKIRKIRNLETTALPDRQKQAVNKRRAALSVANSVLGAVQITNDVPVIVGALRLRPADYRPAGQLWAAVLNSVPHRKDAIRALHLTLLALTDDASSVELATRLGSEILPQLSARAYQVLRQTLADPDRAEKISASVVAAFLGVQRLAIGEEE